MSTKKPIASTELGSASTLEEFAMTAKDIAERYESELMVIPPTLGPGDDDGSNSDRGQAGEARPPLGPGDADPNDKINRNVRMLAQPPAGPGEVYTPRRITVFPVETKE